MKRVTIDLDDDVFMKLSNLSLKRKVKVKKLTETAVKEWIETKKDEFREFVNKIADEANFEDVI